ncbi:flavodoxin family protein [Lentzea nigeriaca]|uniref:flavodoxin family protein n=1 Tax=Lentzea nigeriaca TaxID=1128665 RepID=UPI00195647C2|nr:flavodoxin family protein [Lentzea nigeriaca]MBM7858597.1 multimeric flavodoxin WrbA [Lentzea nigeriaca]
MRTKNVLGICGSPKTSAPSASEYLCRQAMRGAEEVGATTRVIRLVDYPIEDCDGCGDCMNRTPCHLFKRPEDRYIQLYKHIKWADAFVFASPVYALGLPFTWKQWLDRCEPANADELQYQYYNYEVAADVKGTAFQGKVAAQIVTSAGIGQEWAMASLMPLWTNVKLSVIASVGLSLIEFDEQPGIRTKPWGQGVQNAEYAIEISRQIGRRVANAIGFSTFNVNGSSPRLGPSKGKDISEHLKLLTDLGDRPADVSQGPGELTVLVLAGQTKSEEAMQRIERIRKLAPGLDVRLVAAVDQLPHFISRDFVKGKIAEQNHQVPVLMDWERGFGGALGLSANVEPHLIVVDRLGRMVRQISGTHTTRDAVTEVLAVRNDLSGAGPVSVEIGMGEPR